MSNVKFTPEDFDRACSLLPAETCWGEHLTPEIVLHIAQASRRATLEEAASATLNASLDAIWADGRLMDPREVGSACAAAIRKLAKETNNG